MKLLSAISIALMALSSLWVSNGYPGIANLDQTEQTQKEEVSDFEQAVAIIKKYEGMHTPKNWPLVGYGHKVLPGEKFSRSKALSESEADALLRKDLLKNCAVFRSFGADSLLLATLAYNIGPGAALRSTVAKKLKAGDRNIYESYLAHCRYRGKAHKQIKQRRAEEFEALFVKEEVIDPKEAPSLMAYNVTSRASKNKINSYKPIMACESR